MSEDKDNKITRRDMMAEVGVLLGSTVLGSAVGDYAGSKIRANTVKVTLGDLIRSGETLQDIAALDMEELDKRRDDYLRESSQSRAFRNVGAVAGAVLGVAGGVGLTVADRRSSRKKDSEQGPEPGPQR